MSLFKVYPLYNVNPKYGEGCYVYDDKNMLQDRLWPLDFIPRILAKSEWEKILN